MADLEKSPNVGISYHGADGSSQDTLATPAAEEAQPFTSSFFDKSKEASEARSLYFKQHITGLILITSTIFMVLSIFWGASWQTQTRIHNLRGWVVVRRISFSPPPLAFNFHCRHLS
jgi:hypothetical protein